MFCRQYNEAIQELAEGTLGPVRRAELQTHLDRCDECRALAADLQKIRAAASSLPPVQPPPQVWERVAQQLQQEGRLAAPPASRTTYATLLAIAATLVVAIGGALFMLRGVEPAPVGPEGEEQMARSAEAPGGNAATLDPVQGITDDLEAITQHYESVIVKLEEAVSRDDGAIDPETAAVLKKTLPAMDEALAETRSALRMEPHSAPARDSLLQILRKKVNLLQDTIALVNEMRKGNSAGAAQLVDGGSKS